MTPGDHAGPPAATGSGQTLDGRLDSWKEIANFFRREVRTVQLWERHEHLPVHRHKHRKVGTVHAYEAELRDWWKLRCCAREDQKPRPAADQIRKTDSRTPHAQPQITLAVLPLECFENVVSLTAANGLTERITARLDGLLPSRIRVTRSFPAAQRHAEGFCREETASEPDADYLLSGSLQGSVDGLRVKVELMRMRERSVIWSSALTYSPDQFAEMDADLAEKISRALSRQVLMCRPAVRSNTVNPAARYAYLRGRYLWSLRSSPSSMFNAMEQFRQATEIDPQHGPAFSGLADCYAVLGWVGAIPREVAMREARKATLTALAIDSSLAEAHVSMAHILFDFDWDWEGAEREFLLGIDLNPTYAQAYCWYGHVLVALGRNQEAIHAAQVAQDMDPVSPMVGSFLGSALFHDGQYDAAIRQFQHVLHMQPNHAVAHCGLGLSYERAGDFRPAISHLQFAAGAWANDANVQSMLAYAYARAGERREAEMLLNRLRLGDDHQNVPALDAAAAFTALGDHDSAMRYLCIGFEQRNLRLTRLKCDPRLLPLHSDPRFALLATQMRLD
jgi:tetratricopeptide (TPR) repeat protein